MAETVVITVNHSSVLDEPDGGQSAKKKNDAGSKSPGKGRRWGKGSIFKRTYSDQDVSQKAERPPSGRSKTRKESKEEMLGNESPSIARVSSGGDIGTLRPPDLTGAAAMDDENEGDRGKFGDPKKLHKQNKELVKTNTQLARLIETLKHERDSLAIDKNKLKSDLKSSEKELKKTQSGLNSAKSEIDKLRAKSHKHGGGGTSNTTEEVEELQEKVRQLEIELIQRDKELETFQTLNKRVTQLENGEGGEDNKNQHVGVVTDEAVVLTSTQDKSKLEKENAELKERVLNLENDISVLMKLMDEQQRVEFAQSTSMEFSGFSTDPPSTTPSDQAHSTDGPRSSPSYHSRGNCTSSSPLPFSSPQSSLSPQYGKSSDASAEVSTLQNNLQHVREEKIAAELQAKSLQTELESMRVELEEVKSRWGQEKEELLKQLQKAQSEAEARQQKDKLQEQKMNSSTTAHSVATEPETQPQVEVPSPTSSGHRRRTSSSGSLTSSSSELERSGGHETKTETTKPVDTKERMTRGRRGPLQKQPSRENFTAALAIFKSSEAGVTSPKKERKRSETSPGPHGRASASPGPSSPYRSSSGRPPIPPSSSPSGHHSRQGSMDETEQKTPTRISTTAKRSSWTVAERRKSFEEEPHEAITSTTPTRPHHSRTASSPVVPKSILKETKEFDQERAKKEQERRRREVEAEEKKRRELEEKRRQEEEEKEKQRREKEEMERIKKEKEEREKQRKRELEQKAQREKEEKEKKRLEELERKRRAEERERARKEREENLRREREERERAKKEREENLRREREEKERKRKEELEKQRQLREEKRKKEQEAEKERQKAKLELERKQKEEREAALRKQKEKEEEKKRQEAISFKKQTTLDEGKLRQNELEKRLRLEEEKRRAEKAAQAATDPLPSKINQHQSPFGSIAMRRAAFEQNTSPSTSPPVTLRRNIGSRSPSQRPKSMDVGALMSTPPISPAVSPTPPRSPQISSISVITSKSPQASPQPQRREIKEVSVGKTSATTSSTIQKPTPPVTNAKRRPASVYVTTTSSSPPLRRAQTLSLSPASLAVSTPDLSSVGTGSNSNPSQETGWSSRGLSGGSRSPIIDRKATKSVSFSPNLSTVNRPASGILKPVPPTTNTTTTTTNSIFSGGNKSKSSSSFARLGVPISEDMKKAQSLQNIPEHSMAEDTLPPPRPITQPAPPSVVRRPRSERAKTTSLSRADTANLTNLISKMQEKEKAPITNGVSNAPPTQQRTGAGRPVSMYGSITPSRTDVIPSSTKPKPHERKMERRATVGFGLDKSSKKSRLLRWCRLITEEYDNISIDDFSRSFSNGLAFCAILHHFIPDKIPYSSLNCTDKARNFKIAFEAAESEDIPSLLDIEDMVALPIPDWMSVMTYVSFIYKRFGSNGATQQFLL